MEISNINVVFFYITICYFEPINSSFYRKNNLDKTCPYNGLEHDIYCLRNEGNILLLRDFNDITTTEQTIILSNDYNPNSLWLDDDPILVGRYKRSFEDLGENFFGFKLIKLCSSQDLIMCNGLMKWPNNNWMNCIYGLGSSVVDYVICDIPIYNQINQIVNLHILNGQEPNLDNRPLILTLNFVIHNRPIEKKSNNRKYLIFDKKMKLILF